MRPDGKRIFLGSSSIIYCKQTQPLWDNSPPAGSTAISFHFKFFFFFFFARIPVVGKLAVTATGAETGPVSGPGISKRASVYGVVRTPYRQQTDIQYVAHVTVGRDGEKKNRPTNRD